MTDSALPTPSEGPEVFNVPEGRMDALQKRVDRFGRRAAKLGVPALSIEEVGEKVVDEKIQNEDGYWKKTGRKLVFKLVTVHGEAPVVAGHTFIARIEHTEGGNIISKAPGAREVEVSTSLRDGTAWCDHCDTKRHRKDTFIVRDDATGDLKRIGRNCLADYVRSTDAADALKMWTLLSEIRAAAVSEESLGYGGSGGSYHSTLNYLAFMSRSVELHGWTSRKAAYENEGLSATADDTFGMEPPGPHTEKADWDNVQPLDHNRTEAKEALAWAKSLAGDNDYEHNLKVATSLDYVKPKNMGLVASAIAGFRRFKEKELYKAREAVRTANSTHFGTIGSRYVKQLTIVKTNSWEGDYGTTFLYTMEDEAGNAFKWFSSNGCWFKFADADTTRGLDVDDTLYFVFGVKDHGEWNGTKETTITRAKPSETPPTIKWLDTTTGEIFKTKKAMVAAAI